MWSRLSVREVGFVAVGALAGVLLVVVGFGSLLVPIATAYPVAAGLTWLVSARRRDRGCLGLRLGLAIGTATLAATLPLTMLPWTLGGVGLPVVDLALNQLAVVHLQAVAPAVLLFSLGTAATARGRLLVLALLVAVLGTVLVRQVVTGRWAAPRFMWPDLFETTLAYGVAAALGLPMIPLARHLPAVARRRAQGVSGTAE